MVLKGGRIIGVWKTKTANDKLDSAMMLWETIQPTEQQALLLLAEEYAKFRRIRLKSSRIEMA